MNESTTSGHARWLDDETRTRIERLAERYPTRQAVVLPALHAAQETLGWVPPGAVAEIAELLELAPGQVQDTLSFYGFFKQDAPMGRVRVWVCRSISCAALGGESLLDHLRTRLGIEPGETTPDGRITLEAAECLGACDGAPAALIGEVLHTNLTKERLDELIDAIE